MAEAVATVEARLALIEKEQHSLSVTLRGVQGLQVAVEAMTAQVAALERQRQREMDTAELRKELAKTREKEIREAIAAARAAGDDAHSAARECRALHEGAQGERRENRGRIEAMNERLALAWKVALLVVLPLYGALAKTLVSWVWSLGGAT